MATVENKNSFKKLVNIYKDDSKCFRDVLLNYKSINLDVMVCYLILFMTTCAIVKFKDMLTYWKLSDVVTIFCYLVIESNLNQ